MTGLSDDKTKSILDKVALEVPGINMFSSPPEMARIIHRIIREQAGNPDPYKHLKQKSNEIVLAAYPDLKKIVRESEDRILKAVEIAVAGNIIDFGALFNLNINKEISAILDVGEEKIKNKDSEYFAYKDFIRSLENTKTLFYLADNAGEIVFDRILMEEISAFNPSIKIYCAVRGAPVLNDCNIDEAVSAGVDKLATIISNGVDAPGTILDLCSVEFLNIWNKSDMIISKGQGNFESLSHARGNIFFMFIVKCSVLARDIGCHLRDVILCRTEKAGGL